jgi:hypothetical protein
VGTIIFSSISSTVLLQVVTSPYVDTLHEVVVTTTHPPEGVRERKFKAVKINIFGNNVVSSFDLSQVKDNTSFFHPFATFKAGDQFYYVFNGKIKEESIKKALSGRPA